MLQRPKAGWVTCRKSTIEHKIAYLDWNHARSSRTVVCLHGMTRNSRDFDFLAWRIADRYRVVSLDFAGRGLSDRLADPLSYNDGTWSLHLSDVLEVLDTLGILDAAFVGTSMGGIVSALIAARKPGMVKALILNDTGPVIPKEFHARLQLALSRSYEFESIKDFESSLRIALREWGPLESRQWAHLIEHGKQRNHAGLYTFAYDPGIGSALAASAGTLDLTEYWVAIQAPTLVVRGQLSRYFPRESFDRVLALRSNFEGLEFANCGHSPSLMQDDQIEVVAQWLRTVYSDAPIVPPA